MNCTCRQAGDQSHHDRVPTVLPRLSDIEGWRGDNTIVCTNKLGFAQAEVEQPVGLDSTTGTEIRELTLRQYRVPVTPMPFASPRTSGALPVHSRDHRERIACVPSCELADISEMSCGGSV